MSREEKKQTDSLEAKNRAGERKKKNKKKSEENAERELFDKNPSRSYVLRDIWFDGLTSVIDNEEMPERSKRELMFLALSNAILDMVMDILPENLSKVLARNLDDYLAVMVINHEYDVDLLQSFQEEFEKEMGSDFEDDTQFMNALTEFESKWWNQPRRELNGKTPNELIEEVSERYGL
ncbi:MAG: hypothetical protein NO474_02130 [Methanomassiliicoccales archaeon]|nr:hypothetical protein [Methanomassiliicoccales archaeon]